MVESKISDIEIVKNKDKYALNDTIEVNVSFRVEGGLRDAFKIGRASCRERV